MPAPPPVSPSTDNPRIVAQTLWGEARGEGIDGIKAVAAVIANRARAAARYMERYNHLHPLYGDGTLASACRVSSRGTFQFTCWSMGDPNLAKMLAVTEADAIFASCLEIAKTAIAGTLADPTGGAVNYLDPDMTVKLYGHLPGWASTMRQTARIGHHAFYIDGPKVPAGVKA